MGVKYVFKVNDGSSTVVAGLSDESIKCSRQFGFFLRNSILKLHVLKIPCTRRLCSSVFTIISSSDLVALICIR